MQQHTEIFRQRAAGSTRPLVGGVRFRASHLFKGVENCRQQLRAFVVFRPFLRTNPRTRLRLYHSVGLLACARQWLLGRRTLRLNGQRSDRLRRPHISCRTECKPMRFAQIRCRDGGNRALPFRVPLIGSMLRPVALTTCWPPRLKSAHVAFGQLLIRTSGSARLKLYSTTGRAKSAVSTLFVPYGTKVEVASAAVSRNRPKGFRPPVVPQ